MAELSSDLIDLQSAGFATELLVEVLPVLPRCEFVERPMHGCECNPCVARRLDALRAA